MQGAPPFVVDPSSDTALRQLWQVLSHTQEEDHLPALFDTVLRMVMSAIGAEGGMLVITLPSYPSTVRTFAVGKVSAPLSSTQLFHALRRLLPSRDSNTSQVYRRSLPTDVRSMIGASSALMAPVYHGNVLVGILVAVDVSGDMPQAEIERRLLLYRDILAHVFSDMQTTQDLRTLLAAARDLAETQDLETVLQRLLHHAIALTNTEAASILLQDTRTGKLIFKAAVGPRTAPLEEIQVPLHSIAGRSFREGRPIVVADVSGEQDHFQQVDRVTGFETRSLMAVPILWQGSTIGVLEVLNRRGGTFNDHDLTMLQALASQAAALIRHAQLAAERERALVELRRMDERKTQFMHLASHELRTPLTVIRGYVEMLSEIMNRAEAERRPVTAGEIRALLQEIEHGARRLEVIVDEITRAADSPRHPHEGSAEAIDLREVVHQVVESVRGWAEAKRLRMRVRVPNSPLVVWAHADGMREALLQVVNNAVKFTPERGRVEIALWNEGEMAYISVRDSGPGIPQEEQERIFESFYQVEDPLVRQHPGLGLGLTIARQMVEQHGGRIWVESTPGEGSTFTVALPLMGGK